MIYYFALFYKTLQRLDCLGSLKPATDIYISEMPTTGSPFERLASRV